MTFRDDHDAALARATALEGEIARTHAKLVQVEAERDRLQARLARNPDRPWIRPHLEVVEPVPAPTSPMPSQAWAWWVTFVMLAGMLVLVVLDVADVI